MNFIKNLPCFYTETTFSDGDLKKLVSTKEILHAMIYDYDSVTQRYLCVIYSYPRNYGYISANDYSIYRIQNPFKEIGKDIYAQIVEFQDEKNLYKLSRKDFLKEQSNLAKFGDIVQARITSLYDDELAFCEFGAGLYGNISLSNYLYIKKAVYSIADLMRVGDIIKAKVDTEYTTHHFALTTYKVDDYYVDLSVGAVVKGRVFRKIEDENDSKYSYWFMVTERLIGILKNNSPLGYGSYVNAKVHSMNNNFVKFRFESYVE